ncbi:MAG: EamA family transporter [Candidatus Aenigmatarchaeota archaeon]|nr:MAG: EamA family transporter [Candidatus Aenigmarchaeota archaeon]
MIWLIFAMLATFFAAVNDAIIKKSIRNVNEYSLAYLWKLYTTIFLLPFLFLTGMPAFGNQFWLALFIAACINATTSIIYIKALKHSDLSISTPMLTFTPAFLLITSPLLLGEFPDIYGLIGTIIIIFGSYMLNASNINRGYLAPFKTLMKERGPRFMLLIAFIWSIGANLDKIGVRSSSILLWPLAVNMLSSIFILPFMIMHKQNKGGIKFSIKQEHKYLLLIGLFTAMLSVSQMIAISLALVVYVVSIKRMSILINILLGYVIFKEKNIKERFIGGAIMIIGALFITLL